MATGATGATGVASTDACLVDGSARQDAALEASLSGGGAACRKRAAAVARAIKQAQR